MCGVCFETSTGLNLKACQHCDSKRPNPKSDDLIRPQVRVCMDTITKNSDEAEDEQEAKLIALMRTAESMDDGEELLEMAKQKLEKHRSKKSVKSAMQDQSAVQAERRRLATELEEKEASINAKLTAATKLLAQVGEQRVKKLQAEKLRHDKEIKFLNQECDRLEEEQETKVKELRESLQKLKDGHGKALADLNSTLKTAIVADTPTSDAPGVPATQAGQVHVEITAETIIQDALATKQWDGLGVTDIQVDTIVKAVVEKMKAPKPPPPPPPTLPALAPAKKEQQQLYRTAP